MFADRLRDARKAKRYSQTEVSRMLGVTQQAVGKWETGRSTPDPQTVARLAEILDTTADALLGLQQRLGEDGQAQTAAVQRGQRGERAQFLLQCQQGFLKGAAVVPQILSAGFAAMLRTQTGTQEGHQLPSRAPGKAHAPMTL